MWHSIGFHHMSTRRPQTALISVNTSLKRIKHWRVSLHLYLWNLCQKLTLAFQSQSAPLSISTLHSSEAFGWREVLEALIINLLSVVEGLPAGVFLLQRGVRVFRRCRAFLWYTSFYLEKSIKHQLKHQNNHNLRNVYFYFFHLIYLKPARYKIKPEYSIQRSPCLSSARLCA